MDNSLPGVKNITANTPPTDENNNESNHGEEMAGELKHITEEIYKKNVELAITNKTLSTLQKINTIILGAVTDLHQVSQQVVDVMVADAEFKHVDIFVADKDKGLIRFATSDGEAARRAEFLVKRKFPSEIISYDAKDNLFIRAFDTKVLQMTNNYSDLLMPDFTPEEVSLIQETLNIKGIFVYPFVVRGEVIGAMSICMVSGTKLPDYEFDLINRLVDTIGIAIDNSILYESIQDANVKLKQLDKLKDEFVSLASHELRTPMTVIKSYVWLILNGKAGEINEQQKKYLDITYKSTERLIHLVNDMLNISRIESGRLTIEKKNLDLDSLCSDQVAQLQSRAQELGVNLIYQKGASPINVNADSEKISQVLINLIGNSLKFTPRGGSVHVSCIKTNDNFAQVSVKDSGRGMTQDDIAKLFQKFTMLGNTTLTKEKGQGTGLGLYLSKSLIELHGGKIWAESEGEGRGSMFAFALPLS